MNKMKPWEQSIAKGTCDYIISHMPCLDGVKLLDFGAGNGRYLTMFSQFIDKKDLFGAEIDKIDCERIKELGFQCYTPEFSSPIIPFEDNKFDYIFSSNVVEHIPNKYYKEYLLEFHRVLKNDGLLLIGAPNYPAKRFYDMRKALQTKMYKYYFFDDPTHCNKLSILKYEKDLKKVFSEVELKPSYILGERKFKFINKYRQHLRIFGDKFFGTCKK